MFRLGDDEFGLPIRQSTGGPRPRPDHATAEDPEFLEGVVNLRGEVLPVVDQRRRFDMPLDEPAPRVAWSSDRAPRRTDSLDLPWITCRALPRSSASS